MTFYQTFHCLNKLEIKNQIVTASPDQVSDILERGSWDVSDFPILISTAAEPFLKQMEEQSRRLTRLRHGHQMLLYAPLYISNFCVNACVYCGFNVRNKIARHTLNKKQVLLEARLLQSLGIKHILLVSGESKKEVPVSYVEELAKSLSCMFSKISIEIYPLTEDEYRILANAGVTGITIYQETYSQKLYPKYHRGPKADYINRINTPERAAQAGFSQLGIGSLLGLADPKMEMWAVAEHANYLMERFESKKVSISFPRIREAEGDFIPQAQVSDALLTQVIYAFRMALPDLDLVLSTRELPSFRDYLADRGITRMSAGSKTSPGGYALADSLKMKDPLLNAKTGDVCPSLEQFSISDERSPEEMIAMLSSKGLKTQ